MTIEEIRKNAPSGAVGVKVKCINSEGQKVLKLGNIYTALKIVDDRVYIEEYKRFSFLLSRFEVISSE